MNNFSDMLSKAKAMQEKMKEAQDQIKKIEVHGMSGGNLVKVTLTGDYEIKSIEITDAAKKESQEIINDLIIAAYALFLFFILLLKDITKDLKNLVGDFTENYQTIPVVFGEDFSRIIISLITFINVILIINLFINFSDGYMNIYYGISLILLLIFTIKLYKSKKVSDYLELHNILRLIIGLGVFSIILLEI